MSTSNPSEPSAQKRPKKLKLWEYIFIFLLIFPAACAGLVFPLIPDYFEAMSFKASNLLNIIELGRARPWVIFTGMPYPATLRLFGDVCGVVGVLILLIVLMNLSLFILPEKFKRQLKDPDYSSWFKNLCWSLLISCGGILGFKIYFIAPVNIDAPLRLAWYISIASATLFVVFFGIFLTGYILYCRIFVVRTR